jgi:hypothetical protein
MQQERVPVVALVIQCVSTWMPQQSSSLQAVITQRRFIV